MSFYLNANGLIRINEENTLYVRLIITVSIQVVKGIRKIFLSLQIKCVKCFILTILASQTQIEKLSKDSTIDLVGNPWPLRRWGTFVGWNWITVGFVHYIVRINQLQQCSFSSRQCTNRSCRSSRCSRRWFYDDDT